MRRGRTPRDRRRFLKKESDRSGFDYKRIEMVRDGAYLVHPDEWDMPPPSNERLGGERDSIAVDLRSGRTTTDMNPSVTDFKALSKGA